MSSGLVWKAVIRLLDYLLSPLVQSLSRVRLFTTPWTSAHQASLSITGSRSLPKLISIELVMSSNHLILCYPLLLLPSIFPSIRAFSNESVLCIRWPKDWSFSFSISPSNEHPGLISFRMDLLDCLAVQGTLKSLLQHHSSKASILQHSSFFMVQLSHLYRTTGKTIPLTIQDFVGKVTSLLFNMLSRLVMAFLPRSKRPLISWVQSPSAVILEPKENEVCHCFHCFPIYLPWRDLPCSNVCFLVAQEKPLRLPAVRETWVRSLGWEDLLEEEMATHSSILAWRIPRREEPGRLQSMGSQRVGHDWATSLTNAWQWCSVNVKVNLV